MWMLHNADHKYLIKCQSYMLLTMNTSQYKVEHDVFQSQRCVIHAGCNCVICVSAVIEPEDR